MWAAIGVLFVGVFLEANALPFENNAYWQDRDSILKAEERMAIGGGIVLNDQEMKVNEILMGFKKDEIDSGIDAPETFSPAYNFMGKKSQIELSKTFELIKKMPKGAALHVHEFGMVSADYVFNEITYLPNLYLCKDSIYYMVFANRAESGCKLVSELRADPTKRDAVNNFIKSWLSMEVPDPDAVYGDVNAAWDKFQNMFGFIGKMLSYRPVYEQYIHQGLLEMYEDNVQYLELRLKLHNLYELDGTTYSKIEVAHILKNISDKFIEDHPDFLGIKMIYAPKRILETEGCEENLQIAQSVRDAMPDFVIGFDLVGQEDRGKPLADFANTLLKYDMPYFLHAGETDWNGVSTDENLIDAILLKVKRIGHGYAVLKHPQILSKLKEYKIAIEVNPISNQVLKLVSDLRNHPASFLFANNYPTVVSCDDPGLWGAKGLSYDFYEAFVGIMSRKSDLRALKELAMNSLKYNGFSQSEKIHAFKVWEAKWDEFISNIITEYDNSSENSLYGNFLN